MLRWVTIVLPCLHAWEMPSSALPDDLAEQSKARPTKVWDPIPPSRVGRCSRKAAAGVGLPHFVGPGSAKRSSSSLGRLAALLAFLLCYDATHRGRSNPDRGTQTFMPAGGAWPWPSRLELSKKERDGQMQRSGMQSSAYAIVAWVVVRPSLPSIVHACACGMDNFHVACSSFDRHGRRGGPESSVQSA